MEGFENLSLPTREPVSFLDDPEQLRFNRMFSEPDTLGGMWDNSFDEIAELTLVPKEIKTGAANLQWLAHQERMPLEEMSMVKGIYQPEYNRRIFETEGGGEMGFFRSVQQRLLDQEEARESYNLYLASVAAEAVRRSQPATHNWYTEYPQAAKWIEPQRMERDTVALRLGMQNEVAGQTPLFQELTGYLNTQQDETQKWDESRKSALFEGLAQLPPEKRQSFIKLADLVTAGSGRKPQGSLSWAAREERAMDVPAPLVEQPARQAEREVTEYLGNRNSSWKPKQDYDDLVTKTSGYAQQLHPVLGFWEKAGQRWGRGEQEVKRNEWAYRAARGEVAWQPRPPTTEDNKAAEGEGWIEQGALGAVEILPGMLHGIMAGVQRGLAYGTTTATVTAVAGQFGPQAALPEELLTVPAAFIMGAEVGQVAGSSEYWYGQGVGSMYDGLRGEGVSHNVAGPVSQIFGVPYAMIELVQVGKLVPGLKQKVTQAISRKLAQRLAQLAKEKGVEYGEVVSQEVMQELVNIAGEAMAEAVVGVKAPEDKRTAWERVKETLAQSIQVFPFLMGPKLVGDTIHTVRETGPKFDPEKPPKSGERTTVEPELAFSKIEKSPGSANIDDSPQKAYEKVISENNSSIPEYLADQSRAFGVAAEAANGGSGAGTGAKAPEGSVGRNLSDSAKTQGTLISAEDLTDLPVLSESTSEHIVRLDVGARRVVKTTRPLYYGEIPVAKDGQVTSEGAWPSEYLKRMQLQIAVFGSDLRLEGIHIPSESILLDDPADGPQIVISQPWYESVGDVTEGDVAAYMGEAGFVKIPDSFEAWIRPSDGVLVQDAFPDNFVLTEAGLVPIDLQMNVLTQSELRQIGYPNERSENFGIDIIPRRSTEVREWSSSVLQSWGSKLNVVAHDSAEAISEGRLRGQVLKEGEGVQAFFDPKDGKIHLLADRIASREDVERLLRHEGIHWAVRGPLRREYGALLEQYGREIPYEKLRSVIEKYPDGTPDLWIEEYLAKEGEANPQSTRWRQFVSAFKQLLREKFGADIEFTDADVRAFLTRANRKLERATEAESNRHFDGSDKSDPLYSKKRKGPQRTSWDQVRKGDSWNSVKKLLPKEDVEAPAFEVYGTKDEIVERAAEFLEVNSVITDWTGRVIYLPYGQTEGGYGRNQQLLNRAEHLVCLDADQGKHQRQLDRQKAKWLAAVPDTIRNGTVRVVGDRNTIYYFRRYSSGEVHMVITSQEGVVIEQEAYDSGLVTQFPIDMRIMSFPNARIEAIR